MSIIGIGLYHSDCPNWETLDAILVVLMDRSESKQPPRLSEQAVPMTNAITN